MAVPEAALPLSPTCLAERLAGPGWAAYPNFVDTRTLKKLAAEARLLWRQGEFRRAQVGIGAGLQLRPEIRSDHVLWLEESPHNPAIAEYLSRIEQLRLELNQALYLGLFGFEAHLAVYPAGSFYRRHLDRFRGTSHRIVSCILYLNDAWQEKDGGQLRLYPPNGDGQVDVLPEGGTLVAFLSDMIEHEVLPSTRERFSLTGWLRLRDGN